jgi:FkbM family methyltransferase
MTVEVQEVGGTFLPASETHMVEWMLANNQRRNGRLCYQLHKLDMCLARIPANRRRIAVDVGAHVGTWAMNLVDEFEHVICFEPSARAEILPRNMRRENYSLLRFALGDAEKRVAMQEIDWSTGGCHVIPGAAGDVEMRTLDSFGFPIVDFLKVDVEGQELPFVRGARETLERCRPFVLIEQKGWNHHHVKDGNRDAAAFLESLGMVVLTQYSGDVLLGWTGGA